MASHWWNRLLKLCLFAEKQLLYNADKCEKLIQIRWFQVLLNDSCFRDPLLPSCEPRFPEALDPQIGDKNNDLRMMSPQMMPWPLSAVNVLTPYCSCGASMLYFFQTWVTHLFTGTPYSLKVKSRVLLHVPLNQSIDFEDI